MICVLCCAVLFCAALRCCGPTSYDKCHRVGFAHSNNVNVIILDAKTYSVVEGMWISVVETVGFSRWQISTLH